MQGRKIRRAYKMRRAKKKTSKAVQIPKKSFSITLLLDGEPIYRLESRG